MHNLKTLMNCSMDLVQRTLTLHHRCCTKILSPVYSKFGEKLKLENHTFNSAVPLVLNTTPVRCEADKMIRGMGFEICEPHTDRLRFLNE